jgi:hypothetical protein
MTSDYIIRPGDSVRRDNCLSEIAGLDDGKAWRVTITRYAKRRSLAQNRLMWAYLQLIAEHVEEHTGMDAEEIHEWCKARWAPGRAVEIAGEWVETKTTKALTPREMGTYVDRVFAWAHHDLGLILPTPGDWTECGGDLALLREKMEHDANG